MALRRFLGPVLAFQMVVGFVRVAWPQEVADTKGIAIRVDKPAAGAWVGIDDGIEIRVLTFDGILDGGFRVSVVDATLDDDDVGVTPGGTAARDGFVYYNIHIPGPGDLPQGVAFGDGEASGIDTFRVSITVSPQAEAFGSKNNRAVKAVVDLNARSAGNELNNLMTKLKITPASSGFGASRVGDGVRFGIDANRPVHADAFTSFSVVTEGLDVDTTEAGLIERVRFGIGDEIRIRLDLNTGHVINSGAYGVRAGIVEKDSAFSRAPVSFAFLGDRLYSTNLRASKELEEGDFADNRRVRVEAYLVDPAGNLGGDSMDAQTASPVSAGHGLVGVFDPNGVEWIADATRPRIAILHPHPDSMDDRISAAVTQTLSGYKPLPGEAWGVQTNRELNPLEFELSEVPDSIRITHGDSAHGIGSGAVDDETTVDVNEDMPPTGSDSTAVLGLPWKYGKAGGERADLTIEVWDSLGNMSSMELKGIWYDEKAPVIGELFPSAAAAPRDADNGGEPTINLATRNPVFTIDEALDSLSIRYVRTGGGAAVVQPFGPGNRRLETTGVLVNWPVDDTRFLDRTRYDLQILAIDLAGNASVTNGGTLTFTRGFLNPNADVFKVAAAPDQADSVVAGQEFSMRITALDTSLTRIEGTDVPAVTYHRVAALAVIVSGDQARALAGVSFSGAGVSDAPDYSLPADLTGAGMVAKAAVLDGDGWNAGRRDVSFKSTEPLSNVTVMAAARFSDPVTGNDSLATAGWLEGVVHVSVSEMSRFVVTAVEGRDATGAVSGAFTIRVVPTDEFGSPSMKIDPTPDSATYESVAVAFASSNAAVTVPFGRQEVTAGGADFGAVAAALEGSATIAVRTVDRDLVTGTGGNAVTGSLTGSVTVSFAPDGGPGSAPGAPAAPSNIVVADYLGADGQGDQGGMVLIGFPKPARHGAVIRYLIEREVETTLKGYDEEGNEVHGEDPGKVWMHWSSIVPAADSGLPAEPGSEQAGVETGDPGGALLRAVIPALDNAATRWGVRSVGSGGSTEAVAPGKRIFTRESVQRTLRLLGIPRERVRSVEEPMDGLIAPEDVAGSVVGDRRDLVFVPARPTVSALAGSATVPKHLRTSTGRGLLVSARTVTEAPAGAVDNIPPAPVTGARGEGAGGVVLRWTASADDRTVGFWPFRGYSIPVPGVKGYRVMRGATADDLEEIAALPPGSTGFADERLPDGVASLAYRIDAYDDDNVTPGQLVTVDNVSVRAKFVDAAGDPVYLVVLPSRGGSLEVDFEDFVAFASAFGARRGDAAYNPQADVNDDGTVDFSDYATVAASFGRTAVPPAGGKLAVAARRPGVNANVEMTLELAGEIAPPGETISVTVSMANARALNGYGLELAYDSDKFEFVGAVPAEDDLLKSEGGETPLFGNWPDEGRVTVVSAIVGSGSVSGGGPLATFTFRVLAGFEEFARFEIARGVVFDADLLRIPVAPPGALEVGSTPAEFALHRNYPNPFNPQTSIPYDLAEGGDVILRIYNLLGQEVRTLVRERQAPGRYTAPWNGTDNRGAPVSSGVYFYRVIVANGFQDTRRLILIR